MKLLIGKCYSLADDEAYDWRYAEASSIEVAILHAEEQASLTGRKIFVRRYEDIAVVTPTVVGVTVTMLD